MTDPHPAADPRTHAVRRAAGLEVLRSLRGGDIDPARAAAAMEARLGALGSYVVDTVLGEVWSRPGLSHRDRSLIVIAMLSALDAPTQLRSHLAGGLAHGLKRAEVEEIMIHLACYAGFPRAIEGMDAAHEVFRERDELADLPSLFPAVYKDDAQRRADAREVRARAFASRADPAGGVDLGGVARLAISFAFGEVWARPQLSRRDRSLVTVAALAALGRTAELRGHLGAALNHGVTDAELEEVMLTVAMYAGFPAAVEGMTVLRVVQGAGEVQ